MKSSSLIVKSNIHYDSRLNAVSWWAMETIVTEKRLAASEHADRHDNPLEARVQYLSMALVNFERTPSSSYPINADGYMHELAKGFMTFEETVIENVGESYLLATVA